jgi:hypothetical protein
MRRIAIAALCLLPGVVRAQTHAVKKTESVVRAVAVYEWTGEPGKATASRIVPVSLFINGQFEDAGIYMARPVPFVLDRGNIFELEKAGDPQGTVELSYQRHIQPGGAPTFADGWTAYGKFKPAPQPVLVAAKKGGPLPQIVSSGGTGPHLTNKSADSSAGSVDRSTAAGNGTTVSASPADKDPDSPTLHKKTAAETDSSNDPDDPAERPTLKRRTPQEEKADQKKKQTASVSGGGDLNDDPDRPNLHRGKPAGNLDEQDIPPMTGLPAGMGQMVGVSDASNRPEHTFTRLWESDSEMIEVTAKMQEFARAKLAAYGDAPVADPAPVAAAPAKPAPKTAAARAAAKKAAAAAPPPPPPPPVPVADESLRAYTLSYGGAATFCYTASSPGAGKTTRYVSVVAQRDPLGALQVAMSNATDSAHLDRTPWMRLVDAVDADASNRASLLFEQRGETSRQFALYRVIGAKAEQVFTTETPQE